MAWEKSTSGVGIIDFKDQFGRINVRVNDSDPIGWC